MSYAVGIDLGTSNSVVAVYDGHELRCLADIEGRSIHPSVVAFGYGRTSVVGHRAKQQLTYAPENTIFSAKRLMGRRYRSIEVERMRPMIGWGIAEGPHGDARIRIQGKVYAVPEISAHILSHMKKIAEEALGSDVDKAVITVPAYFNDQQRQATRDAATIAGLECIRIINEPTAAALSYGYGKGRRQHIAVYDLGGGTFDISILRIEDDFFEVLSTSGDTFLGGDDFDIAITEYLLNHLKQNMGIDLSNRYVARAKVREAAERAKIDLIQQSICQCQCTKPSSKHPGTTDTPQPDTGRIDLSQTGHATHPAHILGRRRCTQTSRLERHSIDQCLLVGGMTRSPIIRNAVGHYFDKPPMFEHNPDEVVALGAAIQAYNLTHSDLPWTAPLKEAVPFFKM